MRTSQILVNGKWEDGEPTQDGERYRVKILSGNAFGYEQKIHSTTADTPVKMVSMSEVGEMLPDSVLVDLEDFKLDNTQVSAKRQSAARISMRINSGFMVDVFSTDFETLMIRLTGNTSLTATKANQIIATLRN